MITTFERKMGVEQTDLIDVRIISRHNEFRHAYVGTRLEYQYNLFKTVDNT